MGGIDNGVPEGEETTIEHATSTGEITSGGTGELTSAGTLPPDAPSPFSLRPGSPIQSRASTVPLSFRENSEIVPPEGASSEQDILTDCLRQMTSSDQEIGRLESTVPLSPDAEYGTSAVLFNRRSCQSSCVQFVLLLSFPALAILTIMSWSAYGFVPPPKSCHATCGPSPLLITLTECGQQAPSTAILPPAGCTCLAVSSNGWTYPAHCSTPPDSSVAFACGVSFILLALVTGVIAACTKHRHWELTSLTGVAGVVLIDIASLIRPDLGSAWWSCFIVFGNALAVCRAGAHIVAAFSGVAALWVVLRATELSVGIGIRQGFIGGSSDVKVEAGAPEVWRDASIALGVLLVNALHTHRLISSESTYSAVEEVARCLVGLDGDEALAAVEKHYIPGRLERVLRHLCSTHRFLSSFAPITNYEDGTQPDRVRSSVNGMVQEFQICHPMSGLANLRREKRVVAAVGGRISAFRSQVEHEASVSQLAAASDAMVSAMLPRIRAVRGQVVALDILSAVLLFSESDSMRVVSIVHAIVESVVVAGISSTGLEMSSAIEEDNVVVGIVGADARRAPTVHGAAVSRVLRSAAQPHRSVRVSAPICDRLGLPNFAAATDADFGPWVPCPKHADLRVRKRRGNDSFLVDVQLCDQVIAAIIPQLNPLTRFNIPCGPDGDSPALVDGSPLSMPDTDRERCMSWLEGIRSASGASGERGCESRTQTRSSRGSRFSSFGGRSSFGRSSEATNVVGVEALLESLGCSQLLPRLIAEGCDEVAVIFGMSDAELRDVGFGYGHVQRLRRFHDQSGKNRSCGGGIPHSARDSSPLMPRKQRGRSSAMSSNSSRTGGVRVQESQEVDITGFGLNSEPATPVSPGVPVSPRTLQVPGVSFMGNSPPTSEQAIDLVQAVVQVPIPIQIPGTQPDLEVSSGRQSTRRQNTQPIDTLTPT
eukprot:Hpha_TRINITY_DN11688_c0_g1::TRINITY_DN11688_c0_g1_i1::g.49091::m.49091